MQNGQYSPPKHPCVIQPKAGLDLLVSENSIFALKDLGRVGTLNKKTGVVKTHKGIKFSVLRVKEQFLPTVKKGGVPVTLEDQLDTTDLNVIPVIKKEGRHYLSNKPATVIGNSAFTMISPSFGGTAYYLTRCKSPTAMRNAIINGYAETKDIANVVVNNLYRNPDISRHAISCLNQLAKDNNGKHRVKVEDDNGNRNRFYITFKVGRKNEVTVSKEYGGKNKPSVKKQLYDLGVPKRENEGQLRRADRDRIEHEKRERGRQRRRDREAAEQENGEPTKDQEQTPSSWA